jgi:hypothetical protein
MRNAIVTLLIVGVVASTACGDSSSQMSPSTTRPNLTGTWSGELLVQSISTRMTWTLTQDNALVNGPVLVSQPTGTVLLNGMLSGTLTGTTLDYTVNVAAGGIPAAPSCTGQLGGAVTVSGTSTLNGYMNLISSICPPPITNATFTLTRR